MREGSFDSSDGREIVATKATCRSVTVSTLPKENPRLDFKKSEEKFLSPNIASLQEQDYRWQFCGRRTNKKFLTGKSEAS